MKISIINYEAGNALSVLNSLKKLEVEADLVDTKDQILSSDLIILPGVGSAKATLDSLKKLDLIDALHLAVRQKNIPFLGICIGYQIIFEFSEEGDQSCLGWIKGRVRQFDSNQVLVPQIGWNRVTVSKRHAQRGEFSFKKDSYFYFVNSYYADPSGEDQNCSLLQTHYGHSFSSMILKNNIIATQFHLEKSGPIGLDLLKQIVLWSQQFNLKHR